MPVTLKLGVRHPDVQTLRAALKVRGYTPSYTVLDPSLFDAWVQAAVVDFQRKRGLRVDGIVGPNTWAALTGTTSQPGTVPAGDTSHGTPETSRDNPTVDVGEAHGPPQPPPVRLVQEEKSSLPFLLALAGLGYWAWKRSRSASAPSGSYGDHDDDDVDEAFHGDDDVEYIEDEDAFDGFGDYSADEPLPPPPPAPVPAQKKEKKPKMTPEQKKAKEKARRDAAVFKAEVERQLAIERKRIRLDPLANPEQDARLRRRVEQSVRIQLRVPEESGSDPRMRTRLELEEAIERATDDALAEKGLDEPKTEAEKLARSAEIARIKALYSRQGQALPKGEGTYKPTNVSYKIQSAAPVSIGAARSRIPVARIEQGVAPIRNLTAKEEERWLERVERAPTANELDPSKPKRIFVDSKRFAKDAMYRQTMRDEAYADAKRRGSAAETHLVNERGVPLLKIKA